MITSKGIKQKPLCLLVYGPDGKGKTSLGAQFPDPFFLGPEDGSGFLDVLRAENINSYDDFISGIDYIIEKGMPEKSKTLVIDSLDWIEPLLHDKIKLKYKVDTIEKAAGGFGRAYKESYEEMIKLRDKISIIRKNGAHILLIAHSQIVNFNDPLTETAYDRYELKLHESKADNTRSMWREYVDGMFFINNDIYTHGDGKNVRASDDGLFIFTKRTPAYDAKRRVEMPDKIEFEKSGMFEKISSYFIKSSKNLEAIFSQTKSMVEELEDEDLRKKLLSSLPKYKNNEEKLIEMQKYIEGL